jgi:3-hydroxy-9,10-secoandrosta-1,3,5(10)-triene-9,17-dione monooxygenase
MSTTTREPHHAMTIGAHGRATPPPAELIAHAEALRATLIERSREADSLTHYPQSTHEDFLKAGFYRMFVPRRYGGYEVDVPTFMRVIMALGRGCPSSAWSLCLGAGHALQVATCFGETAQEQAFGGEYFCCASFALPMHVARRVDGGWEIDGTWPYSSGAPYSTSYMGQVLAPPEAPGGPPGPPMLFLAPREAFTVIDDWGDMLGLNGSGSNSVRLDKARLPDHCVLPNTFMFDYGANGDSPGYRLHCNPMYAGRILGFFGMELAALSVGTARAAVDEYETVMRTKQTSSPPIVSRTEDPDYQRWFGYAIAKTDAAEVIVLGAATRFMKLCHRVEDGGRFTKADDQRLLAISLEAIELSWNVVQNYVYRTAGSSISGRNGTRIQSLFRDMATIWGHAASVRADASARDLATAHLAEG